MCVCVCVCVCVVVVVVVWRTVVDLETTMQVVAGSSPSPADVASEKN